MDSIHRWILLFFIPTLVNAELTVFDVRKNIAMSNTDPVYRDFYINGGSESGLSTGMIITVTRRLPLYDNYQNRSAGDLNVKVAKIKIIHVQRGLAVGRLHAEFTREGSPLLEDPFIMVGDRLDVGSASSDSGKGGGGKEASSEAPAPAAAPSVAPPSATSSIAAPTPAPIPPKVEASTSSPLPQVNQKPAAQPAPVTHPAPTAPPAVDVEPKPQASLPEVDSSGSLGGAWLEEAPPANDGAPIQSQSMPETPQIVVNQVQVSSNAPLPAR